MNAVWRHESGRVVRRESTKIADEGDARAALRLPLGDELPPGEYAVEVAVGQRTVERTFTVE